MSALAIVLDEKCNNPNCTERLMSGTGVRFVLGGMQYAYCSAKCARTKLSYVREDLRNATRELDRAKQVEEGRIHGHDVFKQSLRQALA